MTDEDSWLGGYKVFTKQGAYSPFVGDKTFATFEEADQVAQEYNLEVHLNGYGVKNTLRADYTGGK